MSSPEDKAYEIMRELDVGYVLVIFGGLTGYSSDGKYGRIFRRLKTISEICFLGEELENVERRRSLICFL